MSRYNRHIILSEVGPKGQEKISQSRVLVIGAGGLGCPVLQYLAAAGVGTLGIIDFDIVEVSNLQRQVLFNTSDIGWNKAIAAKEHLTALNPTIAIHSYSEAITYKNALKLLEAYDIIVDGSDNFGTRYLVNDAAILCDKPLVYGAIYKFEGQVAVFNYNNGPSYRCLFPDPPESGTVPNCSEIGVLGVLPGIIGAMQANEVLKLILGLGNPLSGKLWCYNALNNQSSILSVKRSEAQFEKVLAGRLQFGAQPITVHCSAPAPDLSLNQLTEMEVILIDVRETHEQPRIEQAEILTIPLSQLADNIRQIPNGKPVVFFCQSGIRSQRAVEIATQRGIANCYSLKEGAQELQAYFKIIES